MDGKFSHFCRDCNLDRFFSVSSRIDSESMQKVVFIFNPISGGHRLIPVKPIIERHTDREKFDFVIETTEYAGHAEELARHYASLGYDAAIAVGGDGTVNEVGRGLIGTGTALGIIPCGSGNGLARHIGMPMDPFKAVKWLGNSRVERIDYGLINDHPFFCTCGVGFDAEISMRFAQSGSRGIVTYLENIVREISNYKNETYHLYMDGSEQQIDAFIVTCANAGQWGNNAYIAPQASLQDGMLDVAIIPSFAAVDVPLMAVQLFNKQLDRNKNVKTYRCRNLRIVRSAQDVAHYDGDPTVMGAEINISIVPSALNIIVPNKPGRI